MSLAGLLEGVCARCQVRLYNLDCSAFIVQSSLYQLSYTGFKTWQCLGYIAKDGG